tara:strand:+ start:602 stop:775 length:174 start_codon:yes stop_codon:yes gene_type:complete
VRLVAINNVLYKIIQQVDQSKGYTAEQVKDQYTLADTILNSNGTMFVAMKIIDAEWE